MSSNPDVERRKQRMRALREQGMTLAEIGNLYGITRQRVEQLCGPSQKKKPPELTRVRARLDADVWKRSIRDHWQALAVARFWHNVEKRGLDECWNWTGRTFPPGYGDFGTTVFGQPERYAHRISFYLANGAWPKMWVLHRCNNPSCVNPKHLYDGTPKQNHADAVRLNGDWLQPYRTAKKKKYLGGPKFGQAYPNHGTPRTSVFRAYERTLGMTERIDTEKVIASANGGPRRFVAGVTILDDAGWCIWCKEPMDEHEDGCPIPALEQERSEAVALRDELRSRTAALEAIAGGNTTEYFMVALQETNRMLMEERERIRLLERIVGGLVQLEDEDGGRSFPS